MQLLIASLKIVNAFTTDESINQIQIGIFIYI